MTMERIFTFLFLCTSVEGIINHFLISTPQTWSDAEGYCKLLYTELSYIGSQSDQDSLLQAAGGNSPVGWIGLHRKPDNEGSWIWSVGENVTYQNWDVGQPDNIGGIENAGQILDDGKWLDCEGERLLPFYCMNILVVTEMSWEEALQFCRQDGTNLPNLRSQSDLVQTQIVVQFEYVTDPMWIGLRYLNGLWLWMSGDPLVSSAWPQGIQNQTCPTK